MPLQKLQMRPGVNREGTNYSNEGGFYACDKIRFRSGYPEKIGGWQSISNPTTYTFSGVCRTMWNWIALDASNLNAVGTNQKLYVENGGNYNDITPWAAAAQSLGSNPFSMTSGSKLVTVTDSSHGADAGTWVLFAGAAAAGGITISGSYEIITVIDGNTYTIIHTTAASSTTTGGGASVTARYQVNAGNSVYTTSNGWGAGVWSRGTWGSAASVGVGQQLRIWTLDTYGQDLIAAPRGGAIYYWAKDTSTYVPAVTLASLANAVTAVSASTTDGVAFGSGVSSITIPASILPYLSPGSVISGTGITAGTYITTAWDFSTTVPISAVTTAGASGSYTFSYSGQAVPTTTLQIFTSSVQRISIALGANPYDPTNLSTTFDPLLVRWADQENIYDWVPSSLNQAGEQRLSHGSTIVTAFHSRQENLIFTDSAVIAMQYLGPPFVWKFELLADNVSIIGPNAVASASSVVFWMGTDKFYIYGGRVDTLPSTLRQFVFGNINKDQAFQVVAGTNEGFNEVWWQYPSANSSVNDSYVVYNYVEQLWYYGSLTRTAWLDSSLRQYPMAAFSVQASYLNEALTASDTDISLVNTTSYPSSGSIQIDSEVITYTGNSGNTLTGCTRGVLGTTATTHTQYTPAPFYVPNQTMFHEVGVDDASRPVPVPIEAYIQTSDFDIGDGHNFGFVWRILPDVTFNGSNVNAPTLSMVIKPKQNSGAVYGEPSPTTVTSADNFVGGRVYPIEAYTGQVYTRLRGRQMSFKISSSTLGVAWQLGTPRIDIRPDGKR